VDTEIEVTDSITGRCARQKTARPAHEGGSHRIRLDTVVMGLSKWGARDDVRRNACRCPRETGRQMPERSWRCGLGADAHQRHWLEKGEVVKHFAGTYTSSAVYRELKKLVEAGQVHESLGIVTAATGEGAKCAN
jgi:hypothetical protein